MHWNAGAEEVLRGSVPLAVGNPPASPGTVGDSAIRVGRTVTVTVPGTQSDSDTFKLAGPPRRSSDSGMIIRLYYDH